MPSFLPYILALIGFGMGVQFGYSLAEMDHLQSSKNLLAQLGGKEAVCGRTGHE